jgi:hypothetical protein
LQKNKEQFNKYKQFTIKRKSGKGSESSAESYAQQPRRSSCAQHLQQKAHQQRSGGIDRESAGREAQQGLFGQPYVGYQVPRHTAQGPSDSYCHDLADHFVENAFLLKTLQIYAKFNYGS